MGILYSPVLLPRGVLRSHHLILELPEADIHLLRHTNRQSVNRNLLIVSLLAEEDRSRISGQQEHFEFNLSHEYLYDSFLLRLLLRHPRPVQYLLLYNE